jgi:spore maturation protein CgeB
LAADEILKQNLKALIECGQTEIAQWLQTAPFSQRVESMQAKDGAAVLAVDGRLQDSQYFPKRQIQELLDETLVAYSKEHQAHLFGLGSPQLLLDALKRTGRLTVFESDPVVAKAALEILDLKEPISKGELRFLAPFSLAMGYSPSLSYLLITHSASQRRQEAAYVGFRRRLGGPKKLTLDETGKTRILIAPPFSGGSLSMGEFLARAALELGHASKLVSYSPALIAQASALKDSGAGSAQSIFKKAAEEVASLAVEFGAALILCLAQAPLDARAIESIAQRSGAMTAFWFVEDYKRFGYVKEVAPAYDLFFHIQGDLLNKSLIDWGVAKAWYLPLAADESVFFPQTAPADYRAVLSFLGAPYPNRRKLLVEIARFWKRLGKKPDDFKIFGIGKEFAPAELAPHLFEDGRRLTPQQCPLVYAGSRINLNIHSSESEGFNPQSAFVNPRTFEVAASGGFQIVDQRPLMEGLFSAEELCLVSEPSELSAAIEHALKEPRKAQAMAEASRARVLKEHLYAHRLSFIVKSASI